MKILQSLPDLLAAKAIRNMKYQIIAGKGRVETQSKILDDGKNTYLSDLWHGYTNKGRYFNHRSIEKYLRRIWIIL